MRDLTVRLQTAILTDPQTIRALLPAWDALAGRDPRTTPYDTGTLMIGLGDLFGRAPAPYIVTARTEANLLVGVLPLRRTRAGGRLGGHRLEGYSSWHASYFDATVDPECPHATSALLDALKATRDWDRCDLRYLLPDANLLRGETAGAITPDGLSQIVHRDAFGDRADSAALESHKAARRLAKAGEVCFTAAEPLDRIDAAIATFATLHTERWAGRGDSAEFATPDAVTRLTAIIRDAAAAEWARVGTLRLSGEIVAVHLAFRWRERQFSWRMAHNAHWQAMSPGRLLLSLMVEEAFANGCQQYDLGRGKEEYKRLWPTEARPLSRIVSSGRSWRARLAALRRTR